MTDYKKYMIWRIRKNAKWPYLNKWQFESLRLFMLSTLDDDEYFRKWYLLKDYLTYCTNSYSRLYEGYLLGLQHALKEMDYIEIHNRDSRNGIAIRNL